MYIDRIFDGLLKLLCAAAIAAQQLKIFPDATLDPYIVLGAYFALSGTATVKQGVNGAIKKHQDADQTKKPPGGDRAA